VTNISTVDLGVSNISTVETPRYATLNLVKLEPATLYSIAFVISGSANFSQPTRFRTPFTGKARRIRWGASSLLGSTDRPYDNLLYASYQNLDFFILTGDVAYATNQTITASEYADIYLDVFRQSGFSALSSSTSFIAMFDKDEGIGASAAQNSTQSQTAENAFRQAYGIVEKNNVTSFYRKLSWGTAVDVFVMDIRTQATATQLISSEQMTWITKGLLASTATFKVIVSSTPITDLSSLSIPLNYVGWKSFPDQKSEVLNFIDNNNIAGVMWISGGIGFSILRTGRETTINESLTTTNEQLEVVVGPSGSKVNPNIQLTSLLGLAGSQFKAIVDTWTYTLFDADPVAGTVDISFIDDFGSTIQTFSLNVNATNYGIQTSTKAPSL